MFSRSPRPDRLALAALALMLAPGCDRGSESSRPAKMAYEAKTTGSPEGLWDHVGRLSRLYQQSEPTDPASARELLLEFTSAVIGTTEAILADKATDEALREQAAGALLTAISRRQQADPEAVPKLMAASRRIEEANPKTRTAVVAAFERARVLREIAIKAPEAEQKEAFRKLAEEVLHVGHMTPAAPVVPQSLDDVAMQTEILGMPELSEKLYRTLVERFPEDGRVKFAGGALYRYGLKDKPLNDFEGPGRDGKTVSIGDFRGKVVLIDFWSTGCNPCLAEVPTLEALRKELGPKGFALLGVSLDPNPKDVERFFREEKLDWPVIFSATVNQNMESPMTLRYGIKAIPFKIVVDREGRLVASGYRLEDVKPTLDRLLATARTPEPAPTKGDDKSDTPAKSSGGDAPPK